MLQMTEKDKDLISVKEAALIMGYSRMHVVRLIKLGKIKAAKVGRSYVVYKGSLGGIYKEISSVEEKKIETAVKKVLKEFGPALKKLGKE